MSGVHIDLLAVGRGTRFQEDLSALAPAGGAPGAAGAAGADDAGAGGDAGADAGGSDLDGLAPYLG